MFKTSLTSHDPPSLINIPLCCGSYCRSRGHAPSFTCTSCWACRRAALLIRSNQLHLRTISCCLQEPTRSCTRGRNVLTICVVIPQYCANGLSVRSRSYFLPHVQRLLNLTRFCFSLPPFRDLFPGPCSCSSFQFSSVQNQPAFLLSFPCTRFQSPLLKIPPATIQPPLFNAVLLLVTRTLFIFIFLLSQSPADPPLFGESLVLFWTPVISLLIKSPFGLLFLTPCLLFAWVCPRVRPSGFEYNTLVYILLVVCLSNRALNIILCRFLVSQFNQEIVYDTLSYRFLILPNPCLFFWFSGSDLMLTFNDSLALWLCTVWLLITRLTKLYWIKRLRLCLIPVCIWFLQKKCDFVGIECLCLCQLPAVQIGLLLKMYGASWRGESDNGDHGLLSSLSLYTKNGQKFHVQNFNNWYVQFPNKSVIKRKVLLPTGKHPSVPTFWSVLQASISKFVNI